MKRAIVSVTNDLVTDQRVQRTATALIEAGYSVTLVGRKRPMSLTFSMPGVQAVRMNLFFEKGALFYAEYTIRLCLYLLTHPAELLFSNDLDTLLPNFIVARMLGRSLVYDTHEYFTGVPELVERPFIRGIWKSLESWMFPKLKKVITVNDSIAELYFKEYTIRPVVVRNVPLQPKVTALKSKIELGIPEGKKVVLYQGAGINMDRGLEEAIQAMAYIDDAILLIVGGGDVMPQLKAETIRLGLHNKVVFAGKFLPSELATITPLADIGLSIDKDTNINYRYSLPNKLFDYIHAGLPVLASRLTEVERIVRDYEVGTFIESHEPKRLAASITAMLGNQERMAHYRANCLKAALMLNWSKEKEVLLNILKS